MAADQRKPGYCAALAASHAAGHCPAVQRRAFPGGGEHRLQVRIWGLRPGNLQLKGVREVTEANVDGRIRGITDSRQEMFHYPVAR
jgi:hypothetical protein